jgi:hypothetical protein
MKKSFLLHVDALTVLNELSDEQAGQLFKAIASFQNGTNLNPFGDASEFGLRMAFLPFKNQFARDVEKYNGIVERNKENGKKGGRPKKDDETEKTQPVFEKPKKAVNVNDNVNVNENDLDTKYFIPCELGNTDYQAFLKWVAEGNQPEPADEPN